MTHAYDTSYLLSLDSSLFDESDSVELDEAQVRAIMEDDVRHRVSALKLASRFVISAVIARGSATLSESTVLEATQRFSQRLTTLVELSINALGIDHRDDNYDHVKATLTRFLTDVVLEEQRSSAVVKPPLAPLPTKLMGQVLNHVMSQAPERFVASQLTCSDAATARQYCALEAGVKLYALTHYANLYHQDVSHLINSCLNQIVQAAEFLYRDNRRDIEAMFGQVALIERSYAVATGLFHAVYKSYAAEIHDGLLNQSALDRSLTIQAYELRGGIDPADLFNRYESALDHMSKLVRLVLSVHTHR